jgi:multiple sugar transport system substrate-binding protein
MMAIAEDQIELRIGWWGSQNRHDRTIKVIEMFMKEHPNIKITYEASNWPDHWTKMATQAAGGNLPDIMQHDYARLEEWVSRGMIAPLDEFVEDGTLDFSNVEEASLAGGKIDGKLYAVNLGTNSMCWVLDTEAFEKAGIPLPPQNWTWDDFEKIALDIKEKLGIWGLGNGLSNEQLWKVVYLSRGEWAYSDDGKDLGYEDDQPFIDHLTRVVRLQEAGAIPDRATEVAEYDGQGVESQPIVPGKAAMGFMWSNQIVAVWTAAGEDRKFVMTHVPRGKADGPATNYVKPSMFFSITTQAKHPKEAAMFMDYFTNSVEANKVLMAERGVPISSVVADSLKEMLTPAQLEMFEYMGRVGKDNSPLPAPDPVKHAEFINGVYWPEAVEPVLFGQISPEEGAKRLRMMAPDILGEE